MGRGTAGQPADRFQEHSEQSAQGGSDDEGGGEHASGAAGADGEAGAEDLEQQQQSHEQGEGPQRAVRLIGQVGGGVQ